MIVVQSELLSPGFPFASFYGARPPFSKIHTKQSIASLSEGLFFIHENAHKFCLPTNDPQIPG
jgi:hypothetical protein